MTRRRSALALLTAGTACLLSSLLPAVTAGAASSEPGSGLGSFNLAANAPAVQFRMSDPQFCFKSTGGFNGCEGVLPEAVSTLRNGPIGHGLAAVVWPGVLAANIGSLLITANGGVPDQARTLNDPVRAEAFNSTGKPTVTNEPAQGVKMVATALDDRTLADAAVAQSQVPGLGTFGRTAATSSTILTGPKSAVSTAHSEAKDITIAAVVHIASVISDATATTDGVAAKATGKTTASGITIGGVPVTIDDRGITVMSTTLPASAATAAVNTALASAHLTVTQGAPSGKPQGASVAYGAGSLVFFWEPSPGNSMTVVLGGAFVSVAATKALDYSNGTFVPPPFHSGTTSSVGTGSSGPVSGGLTAPSSGLPNVVPPTGGGQPPVVSSSPQVLSGHKLSLPGGLPPAYAILGVVGSGLFAAGFKRLPDRLLETTPPECLIEETA